RGYGMFVSAHTCTWANNPNTTFFNKLHHFFGEGFAHVRHRRRNQNFKAIERGTFKTHIAVIAFIHNKGLPILNQALVISWVSLFFIEVFDFDHGAAKLRPSERHFWSQRLTGTDDRFELFTRRFHFYYLRVTGSRFKATAHYRTVANLGT